MRWHIKRTKMLFAMIPIISIVFYLLTANNNLYADQSFSPFNIYMPICDTAEPVAGKNSPQDYSAAENFAIAAGVFLKTDSVQSTTTGTVTAMGFYKQNVLNFRAIRGGHLFAESISLSAIASVAEQKYFKDGALLYKKGRTKGSSVSGWPDDITELNPAVYRQRYGVVPRDICKYSVTKSSVQSGKLLSMGDNTYTFELVLDAEEAQRYGRYEMATFAGTDAFPEFLSCRLEYTIDSQWKIQKIVSYDTYNIDIMGGVKANSTLTEVYEYKEDYMPERAQPFIDYVPTGIGEDLATEKGPADYLNEAFGAYISGAKALAIDANVTVMNETLPVAALIDLKHADYRFTVGDLFGVYKNDALYLAIGNNKLMLPIAEVTSLISGNGGSGMGDLLSGDILSTLFANHEIVKTDESVHILMPFELFGISFDVDMGLKKQADETVTADTIDAVLTVQGVQIAVHAAVKDDVALPDFVADDYTSLSPLLKAIKNTTEQSTFRIDGNLTIGNENKELSVPLWARVQRTADGVQAEGGISSLQDLRLTYANDTVFVRLGNIVLKAHKGDLASLAGAIKAMLPEGDLEEQGKELLKDALASVLPENFSVGKLLDLLENLTYADGVLSFTATTEKGESFAFRLEHGQTLQTVALDGSVQNTSLHFDATLTEDGEPIAVPDNAQDLAALGPYIDSIKAMAKANGVSVTVPTCSVTVGDRTVSLGGELLLARKENGYEVDGTLTVDGNDIRVTYVGDRLYLQAGKAKFACSRADLESLAQDLQNTIDAHKDAQIVQSLQGAQIATKLLSALTASASDNTLHTLLGAVQSLQLREDELRVDLTIKGTSVSVSLTPDPLSAKLTVLGPSSASSTASASAECTVTAQALPEKPTIEAPSGDFTDLKPFLSFLTPIVGTVLHDQFEIRVTGDLSKTAENGDLLEDTFELGIWAQNNGGAFEMMGNLKIAGVSLDFMFVNNTVYLVAGNLMLKAHVSSVQTIADAIKDILSDDAVKAALGMTADGKEQSNTFAAITDALSSVLPPLTFDGLTDFLANAQVETATVGEGDAAVTQTTLVLPIVPQNGTPYQIRLTAANNVLSGASIRGITVGGVTANVEATLNLDTSFTIAVNDKDYTDLALLASFTQPIKSLLGAKALSLNVTEGKLNTAILSGDLSGTVSLSLSLPSLQVQAEAALKIGEHAVSFTYTADGVIYVAINNIKLTFTTKDVNALVSQIQNFGKKTNLTHEQSAALAAAVGGVAKTVSLFETLLPVSPAELINAVQVLKQTEDENGKPVPNSLTVAFSFKKLTATAVLTANGDALNVNIHSLSYADVVFDSSISCVISAAPAFTATPENTASYVRLTDLQTYIKPVMNTIEQSQFTVTLNTCTITDKKGVQTTVTGAFKAKPTTHFADLDLSLTLTQNGQSTQIGVTIIDGGAPDHSNVTGYISYKGHSFKKAFVASIDYKSALQMIAAACDIMDLHIDFINDLMKKNNITMPDATVFDTMHIQGLDGIRDTINALFEKTDGVSGAAQSGVAGITALIDEKTMNDVLRGISLHFGKITEDVNEPDRLHIRIDNSLTGGDKSFATISIGHNDKTGEEALLTYVNIANLWAGGTKIDAFNATLDCSAEAFGTIEPPKADYDFSSLDELLIALINTANLKEFEITGQIALKVLTLDVQVPFTVSVKILDDGSTVAAVYLQVPRQTFIIELLSASDSYLYFVNDRLYFIVDHLDKNRNYKSTETATATVDEFLANPTKYLFMLLPLSDTIKNPIENAMKKSGGEGTDDLTQILKSYSYDNQKSAYSLTLGLAELAGNTNLRDLVVTIGTEKNNYIKTLGISTNFVGLVDLNLGTDGAKLNNLASKTENGKTVYYSKGLANISFGHLGEGNSNLSKRTEDLEDSLAVLFPVDAAETLAVKTTDKADRANDATTDAAGATDRVTDAAEALSNTQKAYKQACEKVDNIPQGAFGYDRAVIARDRAQAAKTRAENKYSTALDDRVASAREALTTAQEAYKYATKAAQAASDALKASTIRAAQAAAEAANAAIRAIGIVQKALAQAKLTAEAAGEAGSDVLEKIDTFQKDIKDGNAKKGIEKMETVATNALVAANAACSCAIEATTNKATDTIEAAKITDGKEPDLYSATTLCGETLAAIAAMRAANETAQTAVKILLPDPKLNLADTAAVQAAINSLPAEAQDTVDAITTAIVDTEAQKSNKSKVDDTEQAVAEDIAEVAFSLAGSLGQKAIDTAKSAEDNASTNQTQATTDMETALKNIRYAFTAVDYAKQAARLVPSKAQKANEAAATATANAESASDTLVTAAEKTVAKLKDTLSNINETPLKTIETITERIPPLTHVAELANEAVSYHQTETAQTKLKGIRQTVMDATVQALKTYVHATYESVASNLRTAYNATVPDGNDKRKEVKEAVEALKAETDNVTSYVVALSKLFDSALEALSYPIDLTEEQRSAIEALSDTISTIKNDVAQTKASATTLQTRANNLSDSGWFWEQGYKDTAIEVAGNTVTAAGTFLDAANSAENSYNVIAALLGNAEQPA